MGWGHHQRIHRAGRGDDWARRPDRVFDPSDRITEAERIAARMSEEEAEARASRKRVPASVTIRKFSWQGAE